jgi:alpha-1,3-mannosyltransferase
MRILQVARQFYPSVAGVENIVKNLARNLFKLGHQCDVATLNRCFYQMDQELPAYEKVKGIDVYRVPFLGRQRLFLAPSVLKLVKNYDIVHIHNVDSFADLLVLTKAWHSKPLILSTQGGYFHTEKAATFKRLYFNTITRLTMRGLDAVVAVSEHDRALFAGICPKLIMISDGVDYASFAQVEKRIEPNLMVYVGRLVSNKRIDNLIRAFAGVATERPSASLVIIGVDYEGVLDELKSLAAQFGVRDKVTFTGVLSDAELRAYLAKAHLFVSPSEYESFGISVLEAMSTGTVPVVNDIKPFRAIINSGKDGYLVDFTNTDLAASVLVDALSIDEHQLGDMGAKAQSVAKTYSWENIVIELEKLYSEVLERRSKEK